jgi:segregation and condensation protein A
MQMADKTIPWWRKALNYALSGIRKGFGLFSRPVKEVPVEEDQFLQRSEASKEVEEAVLTHQPANPEVSPAVPEAAAAIAPMTGSEPVAAAPMPSEQVGEPTPDGEPIPVPVKEPGEEPPPRKIDPTEDPDPEPIDPPRQEPDEEIDPAPESPVEQAANEPAVEAESESDPVVEPVEVAEPAAKTAEEPDAKAEPGLAAEAEVEPAGEGIEESLEVPMEEIEELEAATVKAESAEAELIPTAESLPELAAKPTSQSAVEPVAETGSALVVDAEVAVEPEPEVEPVTEAVDATVELTAEQSEPTSEPIAEQQEPPTASGMPARPNAEVAAAPEPATPAVPAPKPPVKIESRDNQADLSPFSVIVEQVYDGPLDLLLDLIRKQDIDIYDIPIAKITSQFLAYVNQLKATDVDVAGEFIYTASLLIHIKSKMLLPRSPSGPDDASEDPRRELVERLLEHERFKNAAQMLQEKQMLEAATWTNPGFREFQDDAAAEPEIAADTVDLVRIFRDILERARKRPVFSVEDNSVTVGQMIQFLGRRLTMEDKPVALRRLLSHTRSERALIAMFLALLELVRVQAILLRQDLAFSEIFIKKHTGFDAVMNQGLANAVDDWR